MTFQAFIEFGAELALMVTAIVEAIKYGFLKAWFASLADRYKWDAPTANNWYVRALTVISIAAGILVALGAGAQANILTQLGYENVSPVFGILITGILLAFGNQFWHSIFDLLKTLPTLGKIKIEAIGQNVYMKSPPPTVNPPEYK